MKLAIALMMGMMAIGCNSSGSTAQQPASLDRTFYQQPDPKDWPGDTLSEAQFDKAAIHFGIKNACGHLGQWALIGPKFFLMKGTTWNIHMVGPYINLSRGYWGGHTYDQPYNSLEDVMRFAEKMAAQNCLYGSGEGIDPQHFHDPTAP